MSDVKWRRAGDERPPANERVLVQHLEDPFVQIAVLDQYDWLTAYGSLPALEGDLWTELPTPPKKRQEAA